MKVLDEYLFQLLETVVYPGSAPFLHDRLGDLAVFGGRLVGRLLGNHDRIRIDRSGTLGHFGCDLVRGCGRLVGLSEGLVIDVKRRMSWTVVNPILWLDC